MVRFRSAAFLNPGNSITLSSEKNLSVFLSWWYRTKALPSGSFSPDLAVYAQVAGPHRPIIFQSLS
jgi:hypothetical protein